MDSAGRRFIPFFVPFVGFLTAAAWVSRAAAAEYHQVYPIAGSAKVHVNADDGSMVVIPSDTEQVEFRVIYEGYKLGGNLRIESRQEGDQVDLTARTMGHIGISLGSPHRHLRIEVRMPKNGDLDVQTGDGSVTVSSISGNVTIRSGDGDLKASNLSGTIDLHTGDGDINADTLTGDLRLHTGDGTIEAVKLDGKCDAASADGKIRLAGRFDSLNIKSGDGTVDASAGTGSKISTGWSIRTSDGSVALTLPADLQANLDASTSDGHITLGLPVTIEGRFSNSQVRGTMNGGGPSLTIHTSDGSIRINKS